MAGEPKNQPPFTNPVGTNPAPGPSVASGPANQPGITTVRSSGQLMGAATSDVDSQINDTVAPLQSQVGVLQGDESKAAQAIQDMFGTILPYSQAAAGNVEHAYGSAEAAQANILSAATQRLNQLKQSRAQEAQALAQEMGGPVSLGEFTAGMDDQASLLANLGAGQQLHTLQYGLADVGQANAFAGRVLPLVDTETTAQTRQKYEDQIKGLRDQITSAKSQRGSKITAEYQDLVAKERDYALQKTQQALDKLKTSHDWTATLRTLKNDDARLKLAQDQEKLQTAGVTGTLNGKPTLAAKQLTKAQALQAQQMGLTKQEYALRAKALAASTKANEGRLAAANRQTWASYLDAAVNPQPGKTVTTTQAVPVTAAQAFKNKDAYKDPNSPTGYSRLVKVVQTPTNQPITNPTALVDYLTAHNVPKPVAIRMVKARLQLPNWVYGEGDPNAPTGDQGRNKPGGIVRPG